jgi:hypothetical protein
MVRLVVDAGLRRGELVRLRTDDLNGRILLVERASKGRVVGPTKTHGACPRWRYQCTSCECEQASRWYRRSEHLTHRPYSCGHCPRPSQFVVQVF